MQEMKKEASTIQWRLVLAGDEWKWNETKVEGAMAKVCLMRKMKTQYWRSDGDEDGTILLTGAFREGGKKLSFRRIKLAVLNPKAGASQEQDIGEGAAQTCSAKARVHIV